ncbi:MAG TPA: FAD-dependent oxidoreductase [Bryobacteraceae bacterium]|nr:FAD-dependent oxidoreductase [Bryobacteraceae bacterium]
MEETLDNSKTTTCCIVGGGPAGMVLGYLLARAGVAVTVLEKHKDFFRDFRGDTIHPSTLELMYELGLLDEFLKLPHQQLTSVGGQYGDFSFTAADFSHLPTHCKFVALMPQWDFLNFLAEKANQFPIFDLRMEHEAIGVIEENDRVTGVRVKTREGVVEIGADLVVGCDGRHSTVRDAVGLEVMDLGAPIDVLWFRISRRAGDSTQVLGRLNYGKALILINREEYFQAGLIIPKGSYEQLKAEGLLAFRASLRQLAPFLGERVEEVKDWEQIKILSVQINRLRRWHRPGLLCIGDAAHAMSPAGGVGINLAIQDAVAAANILAGPLCENRVTEAVLTGVQQRREFPTRVIQSMQVNIHAAMAKVLGHPASVKAPWQMRLVLSIPGRKRLLARALGLGIRPEHVKAPYQTSAPRPQPVSRQ